MPYFDNLLPAKVFVENSRSLLDGAINDKKIFVNQDDFLNEVRNELVSIIEKNVKTGVFEFSFLKELPFSEDLLGIYFSKKEKIELAAKEVFTVMADELSYLGYRCSVDVYKRKLVMKIVVKH